MKENIKNLWVAALRSGTYRQGVGTLHSEYTRAPDEYCCLGVLCDIYDQERESLRLPSCRSRADGSNEVAFHGSTEVLPDEVIDWAGFSQGNDSGAFDSDGQHPVTQTLAGMNDNGMGFVEIAAIIESKGHLL